MMMRCWDSNVVHHPAAHRLQLLGLVLACLESLSQLSPKFSRDVALTVPAVVHKELLPVLQV